MKLRTIHSLSIKPGETIAPGSVVEVPDGEAPRLLELGAVERVAEVVEAKPATRAKKASDAE